MKAQIPLTSGDNSQKPRIEAAEAGQEWAVTDFAGDVFPDCFFTRGKREAEREANRMADCYEERDGIRPAVVII